MTARMKLMIGINSPLILVIFSLLSLQLINSSRETTSSFLRPGATMHQSQTLVSSNGMFELGFFGSNDSGNRYLGVWIRDNPSRKAVWVANRDDPLVDSSGGLTIRSDGNLVVSDIRQKPIIVNSGAIAPRGNTTATLLDSGNFVLADGGNVFWQSFDYPADTILPGMKLGMFGRDTGNVRKQFLVSWLGPDEPASGSFVLGLDSSNITILNVWVGVEYQRVGYWDGRVFRCFFDGPSTEYNWTYVSDANDVYVTLNVVNGRKKLSWFVMASSGDIEEYRMTETGTSQVNHSLCDDPSNVTKKGCLSPNPFMCTVYDSFSRIGGTLKNSSTTNTSVGISRSDCEMNCRRRCSCTAFSSYGSTCDLYFGRREDAFKVIDNRNGTVYFRGNSPFADRPKSKKRLLMIAIPLTSSIFLVLAIVFLRLRSKHIHRLTLISRSMKNVVATERFHHPKGPEHDPDLPLLGFSLILDATCDFGEANKLGEGGFGPVYKGNIQGLEIAVKRLSKSSRQGLEEFANEARLISKLQHRNLVRLFGCCIERDEKILVYEYMSNKSLDMFIFDPTKRLLLDWEKRVRIVEGVAQGLLYLHKYSRLKIIHRDLKTSNILLDSDMNPKISDFGMARIFAENESRAKTSKVVGTYGYMSPEYAVHGVFSVKSDVYSFGVILLEIISGRRIASFYDSDDSFNLLGYAWNQWRSGQSIELMDPVLVDSCPPEDFVRFMNAALLCVQENVEDRPTVASVIDMLGNKRSPLLDPKRPAFSTHLCMTEEGEATRNSCNYLTVTEVDVR